jgi:hypothetical protein
MLSKRLLVIALFVFFMPSTLLFADLTVGQLYTENLLLGSGKINLYYSSQPTNLNVYGIIGSTFSDYTGTYVPPLPGVSGAINRAYNGGSWDGTVGVITSDLCTQNANFYGTKQGLYALASMSGAEYASLGGDMSNFHGAVLGGNAAIVQLTYAGDLNFDGRVNYKDSAWESQIVTNANNGIYPSVIDWAHGDLNGDGLITSSDLIIVTRAYNYQNSHGFFTQLDTGIANGIPEPSTFVLLIFGALGMLFVHARKRLQK